MNVKKILISMVFIGAAVSPLQGFSQPQLQSKPDIKILATKTSDETKRALTAFKIQLESTRASSGISGLNEDGITEGAVAALKAINDNGDAPIEPVKDQIIIKLAPDASSEDINAILDEYSLKLTYVYTGLGAISATVDLSQYYEGADTVEKTLRANTEVSNEFTKHPSIIGATPNLAIGTNNARQNLGVLVPKIKMNMSSTTEEIDWGMEDIGVVDLWESESDHFTGVRVGVIDVGFSRHEDLEFADDIDGPFDDHGNHVSGIACARHNGFGIKGVVPKCQVVAKTGDFLPIASEGDNVQNFMLLFSQILMSMDEFVSTRDDVVAFNASLGYNWKRNFDINPSNAAHELVRANIQNQGIFMFPVLQHAIEEDMLIFSAAGNDSSLNDKRDAVYASPFNWASRAACVESDICSGVIVEAHDFEGNSASFSNINGDISCPGVDVLSTLAEDKTYAHMSGTSMASPYCMGAYVIFSMLRPDLPAERIRNCLTENGESLPHGTHRLNLSAALQACSSG